MLNVTDRTRSNPAAPSEGRPRRVVLRSARFPTASVVPSAAGTAPARELEATSAQPPTSEAGLLGSTIVSRSSHSTRTAGGSRDARSFGRSAAVEPSTDDEAELRQLDLFSPAARPTARVPSVSLGTVEIRSLSDSTSVVEVADPFDLQDIGWERGVLCAVTLLAVLTAMWWAF